jgi:ABC-type cobalamin/Fe3+-siderophores transport system ATPase subunit
MPTRFQLNIPAGDGASTNFTLEIGNILFMLGANGTGKSSLISLLYSANHQHAKRISAHRQTWFESNTLDMTPLARRDVGEGLRSQNRQARARYWEWNPSGRSNVAIFDLIDADTMQERKIAAFVRAGNDAAAKKEAQNPSPIQVINELMRLSNLPIEVSLEEGQKIVARKNGGQEYSVAELSDGERNAFLIAAEVLTAKASTLILIDEPERHLHRSIISPLLKLLFARRQDCAFIISTHELMLSVDTPEASTLLVRSCEYQGANVKAWTVDMVPSGTAINEDLKRDLLGARRKMLFVEGGVQSLDSPLYSLLFPQVTVIAKESCRDVEYAVRGLRGAPDMHWIQAWGLVDNDQRSPDNVQRLREAGIWALTHYSVESLYYHPAIVARLAQRQAEMIGGDAVALRKSALDGAVDAAKAQKAHLITSAVLRLTRESMLNNLPTRESVDGRNSLVVEVDISALRVAEESRFDLLVNANNWDGLLTRYPLRESSAFRRVVSGLKMPDRETYQAAALKLLQDEPEALADLRNLLGDMYATVTGA